MTSRPAKRLAVSASCTPVKQKYTEQQLNEAKSCGGFASIPAAVLLNSFLPYLDHDSNACLAQCGRFLSRQLSLCLLGSGTFGTSPTHALKTLKSVTTVYSRIYNRPLLALSNLQSLTIKGHYDDCQKSEGDIKLRSIPTFPANLLHLEINCIGYIQIGKLVLGLQSCYRTLKSLRLSVDIDSTGWPNYLPFISFPQLTTFKFNAKDELSDSRNLGLKSTLALFSAMPNITDLEYRGKYDQIIPVYFPKLRHLYLYDRSPLRRVDFSECSNLETVIIDEAHVKSDPDTDRYRFPKSIRHIHIHDALREFTPCDLPELESFEVCPFIYVVVYWSLITKYAVLFSSFF